MHLRKQETYSKHPNLKEKMPEVVSLIDKLAKKGVIHKNKAANLKSGLMIKLNKMA